MDTASQLGIETAGSSPLLVSIREAAAILSVGRTTIYSLIYQGEIVPVHVGRCLRFRPEDLKAYVDRFRERLVDSLSGADPIAGVLHLGASAHTGALRRRRQSALGRLTSIDYEAVMTPAAEAA